MAELAGAELAGAEQVQSRCRGSAEVIVKVQSSCKGAGAGVERR